MLVFMCRDPVDTTSKVSSCDFDAIVKVPVALLLKISLTWKQKYSKS